MNSRIHLRRRQKTAHQLAKCLQAGSSLPPAIVGRGSRGHKLEAITPRYPFNNQLAVPRVLRDPLLPSHGMEAQIVRYKLGWIMTMLSKSPIPRCLALPMNCTRRPQAFPHYINPLTTHCICNRRGRPPGALGGACGRFKQSIPLAQGLQQRLGSKRLQTRFAVPWQRTQLVDWLVHAFELLLQMVLWCLEPGVGRCLAARPAGAVGVYRAGGGADRPPFPGIPSVQSPGRWASLNRQDPLWRSRAQKLPSQV